MTILLLAITIFQLYMTKDATEQKQAMESVDESPASLPGGAFSLTDQNGKTLSDSDLRGRVMLVFFGFTHCPDICPVTISTLSKLMEKLGDKGNQVAPVFITVDPKRDTPEVMKNYLASFDKRITGLTGTEDQIKDVAAAYRAYYARSGAREESAHEEHEAHEHSHGEGDHDHGDYMVDHSGYIYLMDKNGKFVSVFPYNASDEEIAKALEPYING